LHGFRAGLGQPVPINALDHEYASGAWDHFLGPEELARHEVLLALILTSHARPRLLDLGCGSGRLASMVPPLLRTDYLGVDVSAAGLAQAERLDLAEMRFARHDFETWQPTQGEFNVITFNECLGYAPDPLRTALRFATLLPADGALLVSHFRSTNHARFWTRLARRFDFPMQRTADNERGQVWDLRSLQLRA
jgi:trans-aconitate methyltransferase